MAKTIYWAQPGKTGCYTQISIEGATLQALGEVSGTGPWSIAGLPATLAIGDTVDVRRDGRMVTTGTYLGHVSSGGATYPVVDTGVARVIYGLNSPSNQTLITSVVCFLAGSRLATPQGWIAVEHLRPGDVLRTAAGGTRAVHWIGRQVMDVASHPNLAEILPVRLEPHAIAPGAPGVPLYLSPDHGVLIDGALVPVRALINGGSIRQEDKAAHARLEYFHIECDRHDAVLAEGLACETYLDLGTRAQFDSAVGVSGGPSHSVAAALAPTLSEPAGLRALSQRFAARSRELGLPCAPVTVTEDPDLRIRVAGRDLAPVQVADSCYSFAVPPAAGPVELLSRAASPREMRPWVQDRRRLGVAVRQLAVRSAGESTVYLPDHKILDTLYGWWAGEGAWRWTGGRAQLPCDAEAPLLLDIHVMPGVYPAGRSLNE